MVDLSSEADGADGGAPEGSDAVTDDAAAGDAADAHERTHGGAGAAAPREPTTTALLAAQRRAGYSGDVLIRNDGNVVNFDSLPPVSRGRIIYGEAKNGNKICYASLQ